MLVFTLFHLISTEWTDRPTDRWTDKTSKVLCVCNWKCILIDQNEQNMRLKFKDIWIANYGVLSCQFRTWGRIFLQFSVGCSPLRFWITNCLYKKCYHFLLFSVACNATLHPTLFVFVGHAHFTFFCYFNLWTSQLLIKYDSCLPACNWGSLVSGLFEDA